MHRIFIRFLSSIRIIIVVGIMYMNVFGAVDGSVLLTDGLGNEKLSYMSSEQIWVEVNDPDLNTSSTSKQNVDVTVTSNTESDGEIVTLTAHFNNFHDAPACAFIYRASEDADAKYNYWGADGTAQILGGGNPKNITAIYDKYDNSKYGLVNYGNWLTEPWE